MQRLITIAFIFLNLVSYSQSVRGTTYFGLQVKPIFQTNAGGSELSNLKLDNFNVAIKQKVGFSFGGSVRTNITKLIAFESGINFVQRNYEITNSLTDTNVSISHQWSYINYEIPLNALIYIQLSPKTYMNTSLGTAIRFTPTDIQKKLQTGGIHSFENYGLYQSKIAFNVNANVGFEYRTDKKGFYYIGGSISVPLRPILNFYSIHSIQSTTAKKLVKGQFTGRYISLDLRYFFPNIKKKGDQPNKELH